MGLYWLDGFESYGTQSGSALAAELACRYYSAAPGDGMAIVQGRAGSALQLSAGSSVRFVGNQSTPTWTIGFAYKTPAELPTSYYTLASFYYSTTNNYENFRVRIDGQYIRSYVRGTLDQSALVFEPNSWYYIEIAITAHSTNGAYEVRVDNITKLSNSGIDTAANVDYTEFFYLQGCGTGACFDDLYVRNDWQFEGDCLVVHSWPQSDVDVSWNATSTPHYSQINETTYSAATYINHVGGVAGNEVFSVNFDLTGVGSIKGVGCFGTCTSYQNNPPKGACKIGSTAYTQSRNVVCGPSGIYPISAIFDSNPAGGSWQAADVNNASFGFAPDGVNYTCTVPKGDFYLLGENTGGIVYTRSNTDSFGLGQTVTANKVYNRSISQAVVFDQTVSTSGRIPQVYDVEITQALNLGQSTSRGAVYGKSVVNAFALDQSLGRAPMTFDINILDGRVPHYDPETKIYTPAQLNLQQRVTINKVLNRTVISKINFWHNLKTTHIKVGGIDFNITHTLAFNQFVTVDTWEQIISALNLGQVVVATVGKPTSDHLAFGQAVQVNKSFGRTLTSNFALHQIVNYEHSKINLTQEYTPIVGDSDDPNNPTPPSRNIVGPVIGVTAPFQLLYPTLGAVTDYINLRVPNLGNKSTLTTTRINRESRGGTLNIYTDPMWPKTQVLSLVFSFLMYEEAHALLDFYERYQGIEIGLLDWEHRYWKGIITSMDPITQDGKDSFTAAFQFEGELDTDWNIQVIPLTRYEKEQLSPVEKNTYLPTDWHILGTTDAYSVEVDTEVLVGSPIYLGANGHGFAAIADNATQCQVIGIALQHKTAGFATLYATEGKVTRYDWTDIAGHANLTPGRTYYLSPSLNGQITDTAPTAQGQYVVKLGRAASATDLDIEVEPPIRL